MTQEFWEKQKPLILAGAVSLASFVLFAEISVFASTGVLGINRCINSIGKLYLLRQF